MGARAGASVRPVSTVRAKRGKRVFISGAFG
jgi:hypothetical protein